MGNTHTVSCVPCPQQTTHHLTSLTSTGGTASTRPVCVPSPCTSRLCTPDLANQRFKITCYLIRDVKFSCATSTLFTAHTFPICVPCLQQIVHYLTSLTQLYHINTFHSTYISYLCSMPPTDHALPDLTDPAVPHQHFLQHVHVLSVFHAPNRLCTT